MERQPLPIGTIVKVENNSQNFMIITHFPVTRIDEREGYFDFGAVTLPYGLVNQNMVFFNKEDVTEVIFMGYVDYQFQQFLNQYDDFISTITLPKLPAAPEEE